MKILNSKWILFIFMWMFLFLGVLSENQGTGKRILKI